MSMERNTVVERMNEGLVSPSHSYMKMCKAIAKAKPDMLREALSEGADKNAVGHDSDGWSMTMDAVYRGGPECLAQLINAGADLEWVGVGGDTALTLAAFHRRIECLRMLIEAGANLNYVDKDGRTGLIWAASRGCMQGVVELLQAGASWEVVDVKGRTARSEAVRLGYEDMVAVLDAHEARMAIDSVVQHPASTSVVAMRL